MNKFEQAINDELYDAQQEGHQFIYTFESATIEYRKPELLRTYTPDFVIERCGEYSIYIETKGYFRPEARTKMRHVKRCNPALDIRIIFQKNLLINKKTGFDYLQWARRNDFPCAIGTIPKEWLK